MHTSRRPSPTHVPLVKRNDRLGTAAPPIAPDRGTGSAAHRAGLRPRRRRRVRHSQSPAPGGAGCHGSQRNRGATGRARHRLRRSDGEAGRDAADRAGGERILRDAEDGGRHHRLQREHAGPGVRAVSRARFSRRSPISATRSSRATSCSRSTAPICCRRNRRCWRPPACSNCRPGRWRASTSLLRAGGSAQKDVDQATSDQQTAEGNFKAAQGCGAHLRQDRRRDRRRSWSKRKVDSTLLVPSPIAGRDRRAQRRAGLPDPAGQCAGAVLGRRSLDHVDAGQRHRDRRAGLQARPGGRGHGCRPIRTRCSRGTSPRSASTIDPNTHRQLVRSEIADPDSTCCDPGMFASFVIRMGDAGALARRCRSRAWCARATAP